MSSLESDTFYSNITSGKNKPFWISSVEPIVFEKLQQNIETDVLIIGVGIAGLTTAYCLLRAGRQVVLVEDGFIGSGESGRTTAHLSFALDDRYSEIEKVFGREKAIIDANSHMAAVQWIENTIKIENIDCNFRRIPGYLFLSGNDIKETLENEYTATKDVGLTTEMLSHIPSMESEEGKWCIKFGQPLPIIMCVWQNSMRITIF